MLSQLQFIYEDKWFMQNRNIRSLFTYQICPHEIFERNFKEEIHLPKRKNTLTFISLGQERNF